MTDGQGRTVDFKNTVIIMTSNIGRQWINNKDRLDLAKRSLNNKEYGARFLKRMLRSDILNPLANQILKGKFQNSNTIRTDFKEGKFVFEPA